MADTEYARLVSKSATGLPTIPPSLSHDNGDWDENDIYEFELYFDDATGDMYTRIGASIVLLSPPTSLTFVTVGDGIQGDGTPGDAVRLKLYVDGTNLAQIGPGGTLYVPAYGGDGLDGDGSSSNPFTVVADSVPGNQLRVGPSGVFVGSDPLKYDASNPNNYQTAAQVASSITAATVGLLDDRGNYNAGSNLFPSTGGSGTAGAILKGDLWTISNPGTLGGVAVTAGDVIRALLDTPLQVSANWAIAENNIGYVPENAANKSTSTADSGSSVKFPVWTAIVSYFTAAQIRSILGITTLSGSNTGDETTASIQTKRPLKTVMGVSIEGAGDVPLANTGTAGTYGDLNNIPRITTDAQGRVIAVSLQQPYAGTVVTLSADQSTTNTAYTGLTGMNSITVPAGKVFEFEFIGAYTGALITTGCYLSARFTSGATGTARGVMYGHNGQTSAPSAIALEGGNTFSIGASTLFTVDLQGTANTAGNNFLQMKGFIDARSMTANGTFTMAWATEVAASAVVIKTGSTLKYKSYN